MKFVNKRENASNGKVNMHSGHRSRLSSELHRSKFVEVDDYKALEYMLFRVIPQKDVNVLAHELINSFGSLANVCEADVEDLKQINGLGERAAQFITDIPYILRNYQFSKTQPKATLSCTQDIFNYIGVGIYHLPEEEFYAIALDSGNHVINRKMIARGSSTEVSITVSEVVKFALRTKAKKIIFVHNHPTTSADPSVEDIEATKKLYLNLQICHDIQLAEHLIVNYLGETYSFAQSGYLTNFEDKAKKLTKI